jgi:hypothetical protein
LTSSNWNLFVIHELKIDWCLPKSRLTWDRFA